MLPNWAGNLHALLWFSIGMLAAAHLIMYRFRSEKLHFWGNYIAVALGGIALVATGYQSRAQLADVRYEVTSARFDVERRLIKEALESAHRLTCDIHYQRSPDSPPYFDQLVGEQNVDCIATRRMLANQKEWLTTTNAPIRLPAYGQGSVSERFFKQNFEFVNDAVLDYNKSAAVRRAYKAQKATSSLEVTIAMFSPYLAAIAFSLALAGMAFKPRT